MTISLTGGGIDMTGTINGSPAETGRKAAGNPWLLTELISGLRDDHAVWVADGYASLRSAALPQRIHGAVQQRLDSLTSRARHLLATAAVFGPSFRLEDAAEMPAQRDGTRPQRTPYALTQAGRAELARRLDAQVREPRREFPEFLGAVSHLGVLGPQRAAGALAERAGRLAALIAETQRRLDEALAQNVPRLFVIEAEYALALLKAEQAWVLAAADDITSGRLAWPGPPRQDSDERERQ